MKEMKKQLRCAFEYKAVSKDGIIEGYASTFGNVDLGNDVVIKGAFKRSLKNNKGMFPILADHSQSEQIGWNLEAKEDDHGLLVKGWLDIENNQKAREKYSMAQKALEIGTKSGMSIGYYTVDYEITKDKTTGMSFRKLKEVKLHEYSLVTFGMNEEAVLTDAKSLDEILCEEIPFEEKLEKFLAKVKEKSFNEKEIKAALERSAAKIETPSDIGHVFKQSLKDLKLK